MTSVLSQCQIQQLNHALHSKMALIHTKSAMAQWIERQVKFRGLLINRRYEIESHLPKYIFNKTYFNFSPSCNF